jgi:hypothetical protein
MGELRPCELRSTLDFGELRPLDNLTILRRLSCEMFDFFQKLWYNSKKTLKFLLFFNVLAQF